MLSLSTIYPNILEVFSNEHIYIYERERRFRRFDPHSLPKENTTKIIGTGNKWDSPIYFFDIDGLFLCGINKTSFYIYVYMCVYMYCCI